MRQSVKGGGKVGYVGESIVGLRLSTKELRDGLQERIPAQVAAKRAAG